jgi:murein DD-endopeptidase MepM/ murein hydrolase activator NlpD
LVNNGQKWETVYAHMQYSSVSPKIIVGEEVFIGEKIGRVGNTGMSTGPHLHFEIRINGIKRNPWPILVKLIKNTEQS